MLVSDLKELFRKLYQIKIILKNCFSEQICVSPEKIFFGSNSFWVHLHIALLTLLAADIVSAGGERETAGARGRLLR